MKKTKETDPRVLLENLVKDSAALIAKKSALFIHKIENINKPDKAGSLVEDFVKNLFSETLQGRFRITSGYIVAAGERTVKISPHVDIIIVDALVPNVLFPNSEFKGSTELIPKESVVGVFEVKRTLDAQTFKAACNQLKKICDEVSLSRNDSRNYLLGGQYSPTYMRTHVGHHSEREPISNRPEILETEIRANPIVGIIALESKGRLENAIRGKANVVKPNLIFTFDGFLALLKNPEHFNNEPIRSDATYHMLEKNTANISKAVGLLTYYLYRTTGKIMKVEDYYRLSN